MSTARMIKWAVITVIVIVLSAGMYFSVMTYRVVTRMLANENIVNEGYPYIDAIYEYEEAHGQPPGGFDDLAPEFLQALPPLEYSDQISYLTGDKVWTLTLFSGHTGQDRLYLYRSSGKLTADEESQTVGYLHGFHVLRLKPDPP